MGSIPLEIELELKLGQKVQNWNWAYWTSPVLELELELNYIYIGIDTLKFQFRQFIALNDILVISWLEGEWFGFIADIWPL